jgi:hypothetical protein
MVEIPRSLVAAHSRQEAETCCIEGFDRANNATSPGDDSAQDCSPTIILLCYLADPAGLVFRQTIESEQFRPATVCYLGDHEAGDEHFRPLFQVF